MDESAKFQLPYDSFLPSSPLAGVVAGPFTTRRRPQGSTHRDSPTVGELDRMSNSPSGGFLEDFLIILGLVAVQIINAVYVVFLTPILDLGIKPLFLVIFGSMATCIFVLPFAIAFENKKWPSRLSPILIAQFLLISLGGVTTFQALMLLGIQKTSPAIASAMPNLAPGVIFIIAACLRFEKVDFKCKYSKAKILGTLICLGGAITMSFLQSPENSHSQRPTVLVQPLENNISKDWIIGCLYLLGAILVLSCSTVLQAATMIHFPAPFSLCVITSFLGAILTVIVQIITEGKVDIGAPMISIGSILAIVLLGGMVIAICVSFQTWAVKKKGPVLVSMFSPIQTVCSAILSALVLGQVIKLGSLAGMFVMFSGLYMVLWAKKKEGFGPPDSDGNTAELTEDVEKPLLS